MTAGSTQQHDCYHLHYPHHSISTKLLTMTITLSTTTTNNNTQPTTVQCHNIYLSLTTPCHALLTLDRAPNLDTSFLPILSHYHHIVTCLACFAFALAPCPLRSFFGALVVAPISVFALLLVLLNYWCCPTTGVSISTGDFSDWCAHYYDRYDCTTAPSMLPHHPAPFSFPRRHAMPSYRISIRAPPCHIPTAYRLRNAMCCFTASIALHCITLHYTASL